MPHISKTQSRRVAVEYKFHSVTTAISIKGTALAPGGMLSPRKQRSNLEGAIEGSHQTREPTVNALTAVQWRRGEKQGRGVAVCLPTSKRSQKHAGWLLSCAKDGFFSL